MADTDELDADARRAVNSNTIVAHVSRLAGVNNSWYSLGGGENQAEQLMA